MLNNNNKKKTILVVEDNPLNMKLVVDLLTHRGFSVLKVDNGEDAVELLKEERPNLIILDIRLPGISGFEVFKYIRKNDNLNDIKVIAMTALAMPEDKEKLQKAGFDAYILKPIDIKEFLNLVNTSIAI